MLYISCYDKFIKMCLCLSQSADSSICLMQKKSTFLLIPVYFELFRIQTWVVAPSLTQRDDYNKIWVCSYWLNALWLPRCSTANLPHPLNTKKWKSKILLNLWQQWPSFITASEQRKWLESEQFFNDAVVLHRLTWNKQATKFTIEWP